VAKSPIRDCAAYCLSHFGSLLPGAWWYHDVDIGCLFLLPFVRERDIKKFKKYKLIKENANNRL